MGELSPYVLIIGYRKELAAAIEKMDINYSVITNKPLKKKLEKADHVLHLDFGQNLIPELEALKIKPSHVIAGTEAAVYPAASVRKYFGARMSEQTLVRRCSNKSEMKRYLSEKNVPMTPFIVSSGVESVTEVIDKLSLPVVVKRIKGSGGRDLVICRSERELEQCMGKGLIYESYIDAPEGSVESFINGREILFTNITNYHVKGRSSIVPAGYSKAEIKSILEMNSDVLKKLKIKWGLTHLEYYRHKDGLLFGEIAIRPPGGYIMKLIEKAYNFNPWEALVHLELDMEYNFPEESSNYAGCWIYHPGEGQVKIKNRKPSVPTLVETKLRVKQGQVVAKRLAVGEDVGYSLFVSKSLSDLKKDINSPEIRRLVSV